MEKLLVASFVPGEELKAKKHISQNEFWFCRFNMRKIMVSFGVNEIQNEGNCVGSLSIYASQDPIFTKYKKWKRDVCQWKVQIYMEEYGDIANSGLLYSHTFFEELFKTIVSSSLLWRHKKYIT